MQACFEIPEIKEKSENRGCFEDSLFNGVGVYLSAANFPVDRAVRAEEDEYGVKHLLLCRLILGNTEKIAAIPAKLHRFRLRSRQSHPTFTIHDLGCLYEFTHSPKLHAQLHCRTFAELDVIVNVLSRFLSPSQFKKCCNDFEEKKISRPHLLTIMSFLAGDQVLLSLRRMCTFRLG
ncbi:putative inactive poly [ADP-ribose] polymerase SRO2 [Salvia divinorum]|uniref:Inactive poly [ADP-ribose] polymerase SRO2 n=1 Tax=Salvia divinorum TaxID=28513 RepID=A0ABD1H346_SALDI